MISFGEEVKRLRNKAGLSQVQLAEQSGMTQVHLSNMENGKREGAVLATGIYLRLCESLGVTCDHFRPFLANEPKPEAKPKKKRKT